MASTLLEQSAELQTQAAPTRPWLVVWTLCQRELVRFVRQRNRVFGAIGQPIMFWILFGAGLGPSFRLPGAETSDVSYAEYFFPGTVVLILLFTAIFTTISVIEDRKEGFLQSVLVAPIPRWSLVLGKLLGGTAIAMIQALLFLVLGLTIGLSPGLATWFVLVVFLSILGFALTSLGFLLAWRMDSTQGFHAVMSVLLFPMWLLSGAFFPADSGWLGWIVRLNPLTYGVAGVRRLLYFDLADAPLPRGLPSMGLCWTITVAFALLAFVGAWHIAGRRTTGDLL